LTRCSLDKRGERRVLAQCEIRLARSFEAREIALLSRDCIECGLAWSWTPGRVLRSIRDRATNVAVVRDDRGVVAFAIMRYDDDQGHLDLFAVRPDQQRRGFGSRLLSWLEVTARVAGLMAIRLQVRAANPTAIAFYRSAGFVATGIHARYYQGIEDAMLMTRDLRDRT
jgi:[ribosomal protein S18]-alanine N-acetyltransferase